METIITFIVWIFCIGIAYNRLDNLKYEQNSLNERIILVESEQKSNDIMLAKISTKLESIELTLQEIKEIQKRK